MRSWAATPAGLRHLYAGVAGGADAILIPEIPFDLDRVAARLIERDNWGAHFHGIAVVAEGAFPQGDRSRSSKRRTATASAERLGGIGAKVCDRLSTLTGKETQSVVLRSPPARRARRRVSIASSPPRFGAKAVELVRQREFGTMVAFAPPDIIARRLDEVVGRTKTVPMDSDLLLTAKALGGVTFGD